MNQFYPDTLFHLNQLYYGTKQSITTNILTGGTMVKYAENRFMIPKKDPSKGETMSYEIPKTEAGFNVFLLEYKVQVMESLGFDMSKTTVGEIFEYKI